MPAKKKAGDRAAPAAAVEHPAAKSKRASALALQQLEAIVDGIQAQIDDQDEKERYWRAFLRACIDQIFARKLNESYARVGLPKPQVSEGDNWFGCTKTVGRILASALTQYLPHLAGQLLAAESDTKRFAIMAVCRDASRLALRLSDRHQLPLSPDGCTIDPDLLLARAEMARRKIWPLDETAADDHILALRERQQQEMTNDGA